MFLWPTGQSPLCLYGGTTGDVVTSAVDDYNVGSRSPIGVGDKLSGNDEMRGVGCPGQPRRDCPYDYFPKKHPHIRGNAMAQGQATVPVRGNHGGCRYECG